MSVYTALRGLIAKQIRAFGQAVVLVAPSETYNDSTMAGTVTEAGNTTATYAVTDENQRAMVNLSTDSIIRQSFYGSRVVDGDVRALVAASTLTTIPSPGWSIYLDSGTSDPTKRFRVVDVHVISPGGIDLAYWIGCSR